jgi:hypothetical protein
MAPRRKPQHPYFGTIKRRASDVPRNSSSGPMATMGRSSDSRCIYSYSVSCLLFCFFSSLISFHNQQSGPVPLNLFPYFSLSLLFFFFLRRGRSFKALVAYLNYFLIIFLNILSRTSFLYPFSNIHIPRLQTCISHKLPLSLLRLSLKLSTFRSLL